MTAGRRRGEAIVLRLLASLAALPAVTARAETIHRGLLIDHVTVVDVRTGRLASDRAVVVEGARIVAVSRGGTVRVDGAGRRVEGRGRFVVPGFNDMHAHNLNTDSPATSLPLMLANGVTGFRQMAGSPDLLAARASGKALTPAESPALLAMPGAILAGPAFARPAATIAEVARQKAQGADFIKVIDVPPPAFFAAEDAAAADGLPFAGHLPLGVDAGEAIRRGMASIEHMGPGVTLLLECSSAEAAIRAGLAAIPPGARGAGFDASPRQVQRMLANPMLLTPPPGFALIRRVLATYDEAKCRAFAAAVAASSTWMTPTLTRLEAMSLGDAPALRDNPNLRYVPESSRILWREVGDTFATTLSPDERRTLEDLYAAQTRLAALFDAAGVKMLTGTDFGGQWIVPGVSLHHEFDLLARAGVSPLHVLQMTTVNPAVFLRREATMGSVAPGRNADLVLLDGDPTASVANLHRVAAVVRAGRYLDRAALDAIERRTSASLRYRWDRARTSRPRGLAKEDSIR